MDDNHYMHIWTLTLQAFDWPPDRIQAFLARWHDDLHEPDSLFYHEDPAYYLAWELLSDQALEQHKKRMLRISAGDPWELYQGVHDLLIKHWYRYPNILNGRATNEPDWARLKEEIVQFLAERGETLRF